MNWHKTHIRKQKLPGAARPEIDRVGRTSAALRLTPEQLAQAVLAIREGKVDALFVTGTEGEWLFTLSGADRAYRQLIEDMSEGALTLTPEGVVAYANRRFAELLGLPLHRVIGSRIEACFAPEGHDMLSALLTEGKVAKCSIELDLLTAGGLRVPTLLSVSPLVVEGLPDAIAMVATDLTGQKRSEAAIQARHTLLKLLEEQQRTEESLRLSLATLRLHDSALGAISQGVVITDGHLRTTYLNQAFETITGYSKADMTGRSCAILQGPGTSPETRRAISDAVHAARPFHGEVLNYRKDGTAFWNELSITPVFDAQGVPTQFVGVQRDVSARRQAEEQLLLAAKVFEQSSEGFIITDARNNIVKVNQAFTVISGFSEADALGQNPRMLGSGHHDAAFFRAMWDELGTCGRWQGEVWNRRKDGSLYLQWLSLSRVNDASGQPAQYIASFSDITQRKQAEDSIRRMAHYDALTGLPNRALLNDRAIHALREAYRNSEPVTLMFIDLDRFKNVNDLFGHRIGDCLLVALAERLKVAVREQDTVSRVGGDEFVLILPDTDADGAAHLAQKLLSAALLPFQIEQHELTITPSIGIALFPNDGTDFEALSKCADAAMYRAKHEGGNSFRFYTDEIQAHSERVLLLENALRRALERGQMQLYYQPQQSLCGTQIVGAEALLRWQDPQLGPVSPAEFIPVAENSGLINSIGEWVLRTAVQQLKVWRDAGMAPITMAVNLSAMQFRQQNLLELVGRILEEAGVPPHCLELELTESVASDDPMGAIEVMNKLHACGVRMSIDDFGTGYSSLSYLKRFKLYRLKIDQSFVRNVTENPEDQAIVTAIISLASSLGMQTIAEGVETEGQMEYLRAKGCHAMQGYWLSRPLPAEQFKSFVDAM